MELTCCFLSQGVTSVIGDAKMTGAHDKFIALNNAGELRGACWWCIGSFLSQTQLVSSLVPPACPNWVAEREGWEKILSANRLGSTLPSRAVALRGRVPSCRAPGADSVVSFALRSRVLSNGA
eukprot:Tamp_23095.p3 GENE.Tamp_23095~~Tamp_23095.p3  ORF type:complete len:123 (+),score=4.67 Tamp_23095:406-774(+)